MNVCARLARTQGSLGVRSLGWWTISWHGPFRTPNSAASPMLIISEFAVIHHLRKKSLGSIPWHVTVNGRGSLVDSLLDQHHQRDVEEAGATSLAKLHYSGGRREWSKKPRRVSQPQRSERCCIPKSSCCFTLLFVVLLRRSFRSTSNQVFERKFLLPVCQRVLGKRRHLRDHDMIHSGEKPSLACPHCSLPR